MNIFIERFKEKLLLLCILILIFLITITYEYSKYKDFKDSNFLEVRAKVVNVYKKTNSNILKLTTPSYDFFTKTDNTNIKTDDIVKLIVITKNKYFYEYINFLYLNSINISVVNSNVNILSKLINDQHSNSSIREIFNALFLAKPLSKELKEKFSVFGISHLVAISGFHLGVLSFVMYWIIYLFYAPLQQKYFPYRNRRFDIMIFVVAFLFSYLILTNMVPSLLRAFVMLVLGLYFLRCKIKILSFNTLLVTLLFIVALYPRYIFSLGLWFSVFGVFYIYLFLQYFSHLNKIVLFIFFNIWIYLSLNPVIHYFFAISSYEQLLSPLVTLLFTLFYPLELFLHFIGVGSLLDKYLEVFLSYEVYTFEVLTPLWFLVIYILSSMFSILYKKAFIILNALLIGFNLYLFI